MLTVAFLMASLAGTVGSGWFLGDVIAPTRADPLVAFPSPVVYMTGLAVLAEILRLILALQGERIWRGSPFQGAVFAGPLWLTSTAYCTLVPLMTIAVVYVGSSALLTIIAVTWLFIQIAAGLLPGISWPAVRQADSDQIAAHPAQPLPPTEDRVRPPNRQPKLVASAEDLLQLLSHLAELPEGSRPTAHSRIGPDREIIISQSSLAALTGRSKPTVRRWLQDLEQRQRIVKSSNGKETRLRLQHHRHTQNGHAPHIQANGSATPSPVPPAISQSRAVPSLQG